MAAPIRPGGSSGARQPARAEGNKPAAKAQASHAKAAKSAKADAQEPVKDNFTAGVAKPYAQLASRGNFDGYVKTASGVEAFVRIRVGRNADTRPPLVYLDGLNGAADRGKHLDELADVDGITVVSIAMIGQGETLVRDVDKHGGKSIAHDIDPEDQVKLVLESLDELGVKGPVNLAGLSYGGGIAARIKHEAPERVAKLLLAAPYTVSAFQQDPVRMGIAAVMNNPFNPLGSMIYRTAATSALAMSAMAPKPIRTIEEHVAYVHALEKLTMGMEKFNLSEELKGVKDVHMLTVPFDPIVPPAIAHAAHDKAASGSYTQADWFDTLAHDLIDWRPSTLVKWMREVLRPEQPAKSAS